VTPALNTLYCSELKAEKHNLYIKVHEELPYNLAL
jgi:hypothetical protein